MKYFFILLVAIFIQPITVFTMANLATFQVALFIGFLAYVISTAISWTISLFKPARG